MADINGIAEQIQGLTLLEASQLVKMLEERLRSSERAVVRLRNGDMGLRHEVPDVVLADRGASS